MMAWTTAKVKLTELNPHLICVLCGGYYIDATTITECLHTFCKTCIVRYLETSKYCPVCDVMVHKTKPLLHIRSDHLLQALVYKTVPGLFTSEITKRKLFSEEQGGSDVGEEALEEGMLGSKYRTTDIMDHYTKRAGAEKEKMSLSLQFSPNGRPIDEYDFSGYSSDSEFNEEMTQPRYLLCPAAFSVYHLKKFLRKKFDLNDSFLIDVFHIDEPLCDKYTLMDIAYVYSWRRLGPLRLYYSVYQNPAKKRKYSHVTSVSVPPADDVKVSQEEKTFNSDGQTLELSDQKSVEKPMTKSAPAEDTTDVRLVSEITEEKKHKKGHHSKSKSHKRNKKDKDKNKERRKKKKKSKKSQMKSSKHKSHKSSRKRKELESVSDIPTKCSKLSTELDDFQPAESCSASESLGEGTSGSLPIDKKNRHSKDRKDKGKIKKSKKKIEKTEKVKTINDRQPILLKLHKESYQLKASNDGKEKPAEKACFQRKDAQEIMKHVDLKRELFKNCATETFVEKTSDKTPEVNPVSTKELPTKPKEDAVKELPKDVRKTVKVLVLKERHRKEQAVVPPTCKSMNGDAKKSPEPPGSTQTSSVKEKVKEASKLTSPRKSPEPKPESPLEKKAKAPSLAKTNSQTSTEAVVKHLDNKPSVIKSVNDESKRKEKEEASQSKETISPIADKKRVSTPPAAVSNGSSSSPVEPPKSNGNATVPVNGQKKLDFRPFGSKTVIRPTGSENKRKCLSDITFPLARPVNKVSHKSPSLSPVIPEGGLGKISPPPHLKLTLPKYPLLSDRQSKSKSPIPAKKQMCVSSDMQPLDLASSSSSSKSPRAKSPIQSCRQPVVLNQPRFNLNHSHNKTLSVSPTKNPLSLKISLSPTRSSTPLYPHSHSQPKESLQRQTSLPEARHHMPQQQPSRPTDYPLVARKADSVSRFAQKRPAPVEVVVKPAKSPKKNGSELHVAEAVDLSSGDCKISEVNHNSIQIVNEPGPLSTPQPLPAVFVTEAIDFPKTKARSPDRSNSASPASSASSSSSSSVQTQTDSCEVKNKCMSVARPLEAAATL